MANDVTTMDAELEAMRDAALNELAAGVPRDCHPMFIGHQANALMLEAVCRRTATPSERHLFNVDRYGNCGAAGAPSVFSQNWDRIDDGYLNLAVVGSGLTWGGVQFKFCSNSTRE